MKNNLEWLRTDFLSGDGMFGPFLSLDEISKSKMFIETMEDFIKSSEDEEVASLSRRICHLSAEQRDEYWQDNYPVHWQEIFATRIRSTFVIQLCSSVEGQIDEVCRRIEMIARVPLKLSNLNGSILEKGRRYMEAFGSFTAPSDADWKVIERIFQVRNVFVHERGFIGKYQHENKIIEFAKFVPGLKLQNSFIELELGFCEHCVVATAIFVECLRESYEAFRSQRQLLEKLEAPEGN